MDHPVASPKRSSAAGGWGALKSCGKHLLSSRAPLSGARAMLKANQPDGFDCPGCAWGDPAHGSSFEFCENGVKAVSWEATDKRTPPKFFAKHTVSELRGWTDYALEGEGRLTHPMRYDAASDRYLPVSWDAAFTEIGATLRGLDSPDRAEFYTSGRASNEAAYIYQLFARLIRHQQLPRLLQHGATRPAASPYRRPSASARAPSCSRISRRRTRSSWSARTPVPTIRACSATFARRRPAAPASWSTTPFASAGWSVSPIRRTPWRCCVAPAHPWRAIITSRVRAATWRCSAGIAKAVFAADDAALAAGRPSVLDRAFLSHHAEGHEAYRVVVEATTWEAIEDQSGLSRADIEVAAEVYLGADKVICTWAMGVTQHKHSVATIREMTNVMLLRGNIGRPGAGLCPVRGHSNVQGDRTVGINEKPPAALLDALEREIGFVAPRKHGHNVIGAIGAMLDGSSKAFIGLGGNFARATPDTALVAKALASCELTVHIATKLNHSHLVPGRVAYLLPCIGRTEIDRNSKGKIQIVTVEDSMSMVHGSGGINKPASPELRSEIAIIAGMAAATVGSDKVDWAALADDYDGIRALIERTIPGFAGYNARVRRPRGFMLRNLAAERNFETTTGKANFSAEHLPEATEHQPGADEGRHLRAADLPQPRSVQHHRLWPRRPLSRGLRRASGTVRPSRRPGRDPCRRRRPRRYRRHP